VLFNLPLDKIDERQLQSLVENRVAEGRQIEYKAKLPSNDHEQIKEFLKDVSAMANTIGGDILYGVKEGTDKTGNTVAQEIAGIANADMDTERSRLENLLRDCLEPRLLGQQIEPITLSNGNYVLLVRVPRSWNSPHVVKHQKHWRFYFRNSAGSHPMDVTELRHSVLSAASFRQGLEEFRYDRLAKIASDKGLRPGCPKVVVHFLPLESTREDFDLPPALIREACLNSTDLMPMQYDRTDSEVAINFDGLIAYVNDRSERTGSGQRQKLGYVQFFRDGRIEEVHSGFHSPLTRNEESNTVPIEILEAQITNGVRRRLTVLERLGIRSPILMYLSLISVKHLVMGTGRGGMFLGEPIDRDDLLLRGVLIQSFQGISNVEQFIAELLRPLFSQIRNAAGWQ